MICLFHVQLHELSMSSQRTWLASSAIVAMPSFKASPMKKIQANNKASKHTTKKNPVKAMKPLKGMKGMKAIKASKGKGSMESPKCRPQCLARRELGLEPEGSHHADVPDVRRQPLEGLKGQQMGTMSGSSRQDVVKKDSGALQVDSLYLSRTSDYDVFQCCLMICNKFSALGALKHHQHHCCSLPLPSNGCLLFFGKYVKESSFSKVIPNKLSII